MVEAAPTGDAPTTSEWSTISLPTKVWLILEVWQHLMKTTSKQWQTTTAKRSMAYPETRKSRKQAGKHSKKAIYIYWRESYLSNAIGFGWCVYRDEDEFCFYYVFFYFCREEQISTTAFLHNFIQARLEWNYHPWIVMHLTPLFSPSLKQCWVRSQQQKLTQCGLIKMSFCWWYF